ncbi:MAG: 30S ribosomal protein S5 [Dongiaceae bacterium]
MTDTENTPAAPTEEAAKAPPAEETRQGRGRGGRGGRDGSGGGRRRKSEGDDNKGEGNDGERQRPVAVRRVAKVVKGGKNFSIAALVVVGDGKGKVGFGTGKAREVQDAMRKATDSARRRMVRIPLREGRTLHHDLIGTFGAGRVHLRAAPPGTGIIAGGPMRAVFEALGVSDVVAKSLGSSNPHNMVRATFDALTNMNAPRSIAAKRGKKISDIVTRRGGAAAAAAE